MQNESNSQITFSERNEIPSQWFQRLLSAIPQVHWIRHKDQIIFISDSYEGIWESSCKELRENPNSFVEKVHPDDLSRINEAFNECFRTGEFDEEYRLLMSDGRIKWIHSRSFVDPIDETHYGVAEEITQRKENEETIRAINSQLHQSLSELRSESEARKHSENENREILRRLEQTNRLESLGKLSSSVAHDFNNILLAMQMNLDLIRLQSNSKDVLSKVDDLEMSAKRATEICSMMQQFGGKSPVKPVQVDMNQQVSDAIRILKSTKPKSVSLDYIPTSESAMIPGSPSEIQQVLLNLITNSLEAVDFSGKIELSLHRASMTLEDQKRSVVNVSDPTQEFLILTCQDNGKGIPADEIGNIFDPFYSMKGTGRGLGLASVIGIAKGHGGTIVIDSEQGAGTRIRVFFPQK